MTTVLVADPDADRRETTVETLETGLADADVRAVASLDTARDAVDATLDAVVTTHDLGDGTGMELAEHVRERTPETGVILYSETEDVDTATFEETVVEYVPRAGPDAADLLVELVAEAGEGHGQAAYPLPDDEEGRLDAVAACVEGTDPERTDRALDRVVALAVSHFGAEGASLALLGEREQELLASHGDPKPPSPRDRSLATYTILEERTMAVEDTAADPRFADNDALQSRGVRAYLGATLRTPDGHNVGALGVYDDAPRPFSAADEDYLATLADLAMDVLVLGRGDEP